MHDCDNALVNYFAMKQTGGSTRLLSRKSLSQLAGERGKDVSKPGHLALGVGTAEAKGSASVCVSSCRGHHFHCAGVQCFLLTFWRVMDCPVLRAVMGRCFRVCVRRGLGRRGRVVWLF